MLRPYLHELLDHPRIQHGFFGRKGGSSSGIYESLNLGFGSKDDPACLAANKQRVRAYFNGGTLATLYQHHSAQLVEITKDNLDQAQSRSIKADAMVTTLPDIMLGILTADCVPILFSDAENGVIAATHAGWKGCAGGIIQNTVASMIAKGSAHDTIIAVIGPAIGQQSYEVDQNFKAQIISNFEWSQSLFIAGKRPLHFQFDLPRFAHQSLLLSGILPQNIGQLDLDTYTMEQDFFSYRRATHQKQADYGRQLSAIMRIA